MLDKKLQKEQADRALREAVERRNLVDSQIQLTIKEIGGRSQGKDPVRYGDWELKGRAIDF